MKMTNTENFAKDILKKGYVRRLAPDESGGFVASILEFPGCVAEGDSADEALQNLEKAAESWITVAIANGQSVRDPIDFNGFSGKLALRLPRTLHKQAAEIADLERCSLNQLFVTAIASYIGGKQQEQLKRKPSFNLMIVKTGENEIPFSAGPLRVTEAQPTSNILELLLPRAITNRQTSPEIL